MSERVTYLEFEAPCCNSVRTCKDTAHYVISLTRAKILRKVKPVRCHQGVREKYRFYPSEDVVLVHHYTSTRGVSYLQVLWKPESADMRRVIEVARRALGLLGEQVVVVGEAEENE